MLKMSDEPLARDQQGVRGPVLLPPWSTKRTRLLQERSFSLALPVRNAQIAECKYCRPHARPFRLGFPRKVPMFPVCSPAALQALGRAWSRALAAVNLAPAVRHGCRSAGLAGPLGSSPAAGSSVCPNQCLKACPHALNRFALARKGAIAHFRSLLIFAIPPHRSRAFPAPLLVTLSHATTACPPPPHRSRAFPAPLLVTLSPATTACPPSVTFTC
jgi:hypothetical protein